MIRLLCLAVGYVFGLFPSGLIMGKLYERNLLKEGSGNPGATNALRVLGLTAGLLTFFGDAMKSVIAIIVMRRIIDAMGLTAVLPPYLSGLFTGLGSILGHDYPFYLKFRGGKGVSSFVGTILFTDLRMGPIPAVFFFTAVILTKYVSLGSILMAAVVAVQFAVFGMLGHLPLQPAQSLEACILVAVMSLLTIWQHRANIGRLRSGTENKIGSKKKS